MSKKNEVAVAAESTAVAVVEPKPLSRFLALQPESDVAQAFAANYGPGDEIQQGDLTVLKVPSGGSTTWTFEDVTGEVMAKEVEGVIVAYQPFGVLWPQEKSTEGSRPFMVTHDLRIGHRKSDDYGDMDPAGIEACRLPDGTYDWQKLPQNQWGSGKGKGKRCKEQRIMCILRSTDVLPLLLRVPPGSLSSVGKFVKKMTVPFFRCVVGLSLIKETSAGGDPYAIVKPRFIEALTAEEGLAIRSRYTESLTNAIREYAEQTMETSAAQDDLE